MLKKQWKTKKIAMISLIFFVLLVFIAVLAPVFAPYHPNEITGNIAKGPNAEHILGTDQVGRDMLSRMIYATRTSLLAGFLATLIATGIGVILGLLSGYFGGIVDHMIMRFTDMIMSFPYLLLVLVSAAIFEPGLWNLILILGFVDWPGVARLVRGNVLSLRESEFVKADLVAGLPKRYIIFREILPNTLAPVFVYATSVFALTILDEAALSFLGMGVQPPMASLGNILNGAQSLTVLTSKFWLWVPAGIEVVLLVMSVNFIGDALRDLTDPKEK